MIWYILAGIAALVALLLLVPLSLTLSMDEAGQITLRGRVLGVPVYRSPRPSPPVKLSDYSPRAIRRRERAAARKARRAERRALRRSKARRGSAPPPDVPLATKLTFIKDLIGTVFKRSLKHARVDVERLAITVATPDAAQTAILYGGVCAALAALTEALHQFSHLRIRHPDAYGVAADFTSEKTRADLRIHFRFRLYHVLDVGLHALGRLIRRAVRSH